jgi:hypothetical protein
VVGRTQLRGSGKVAIEVVVLYALLSELVLIEIELCWYCDCLMYLSFVKWLLFLCFLVIVLA